jgi:preprotein translocase SecE subunit
MKKVSWPGRSEIIKSTIVVIVTIILFALIIGGMDIAFFQILQVIFR